MKRVFRKSLKRQSSIGHFGHSLRSLGRADSTPKTSNPTRTPLLWEYLREKYQFNYPRDWYRIEAHWLDQIESFQEQPIDCPGRDGRMNNAITRISQCNESYQLCNSLPKSFIVPKDLTDFTLMNSMSTVIKDHRVPIISYCCPIEYRRNFIIRCASSDQQSRVIDTLDRVVKPLRVLNLNSLAPNLAKVEIAHKKLRDACRPGEETSNFLSKSGKWLKIVSRTLKLVRGTAKILLTDASVLLIEEEDRGWNSVISSLVQLLLEPHRRTIEGLESLISKEWIYLSGGQTDYSRPDTLFTLFLECIYQIYIQNVNRFEFTSEYLRYLFEAQYNCLPMARGDSIRNICNNGSSSRSNGNKNKMSKSKTYGNDERMVDVNHLDTPIYKTSSTMVAESSFSIIKTGGQNVDDSMGPARFENGYNLSMFNPFYKLEKDSPTVEIHDHIANMRLWCSLYLRWQPRISYGCVEEVLYFQLSSTMAETERIDAG